MIDAAAADDGTGFTAEDHPVGMLGVMRGVIFFGVIVAGELDDIGAFLRALPGHIVAAEGDRSMAVIVLFYLVRQRFCPILPALRCVHIIDLIADRP